MKNFTRKGNKLFKVGIVLISLFAFSKSYGQFTSGNLVVLQVSDGVASLASTGNVVILREFTPGGTPAFSVGVPATGTNALIMSGAATSEGALSLSSNNKYLVFGGYAAPITNTSAVASSNSIPRAISIIDAAGNYTMVNSSSTFHLGNNIRSAASDGNNNYWSAGGNDGTDYFGTVSPTVNIQNTVTNTRCINTFNNNLYFSTGSGTKGVYKIGTGLPVTSAQTNSIIVDVSGSGSGTQSPYAFFFNPAQTICYVADDRSIANGGGIQKWVNTSSTWTLAYTIGTGSASTVGARGVVANFSGTNPVIYATTAEGTNNRLISIVDAGATSSASTIATSTTNAIFRGLSFSPCNAPSIISVTSNGTICANQTLSLTANTASSSSVTYSWNGTGTFASPTSSNSAVTGAVTGNYTVTVTNGCGSSSSTVSVTVLPSPTITINSSSTTVCSGQTVALTASGANTYTWSNSISNGGVFNPATTAVYTATGNANSCSGTATISINVNPLPALNVNSITICSGQPGTLTASGASTYSWNNSSTSSSIVVTPVTNTNYVVVGTSSLGCKLTLTTQIIVTSSPAIVVNSSTICAGTTATLTAGGASTFTWSTGAFTNSITVSPATNTTYIVAGSLVGCAGVASNTAVVSVNSLPVLTVSGNTFVCTGSSLSQTLSGAASYSMNGTNTNSVFTLTPASTTNYTFTGNSSAGCSATLTRTITVVPLPVISVSGGTEICAGSTISQTLSGATSYSLNGNSTSSVSIVTPTSTTNYIISGIDNNGCAGTTTRTITVNSLPLVNLSSTSPTMCAGMTVTITASGASTYTWANGAGSGASIVVNPTVTTTYSATGATGNNCSAGTQFVQNVSQCTSIDQLTKASSEYNLYPNPANDFIAIDNLSGDKNEIKIVNALGAIVFVEKYYNSSKMIDVSGLSRGIYFVQIYSDNKTTLKKLIIK